MSILDVMGGDEQPSELENPANSIEDFLRTLQGADGSSLFVDGLPLGSPGAMKILTFATCVHIIAETISHLPLGVFRQEGENRVRAEEALPTRIRRLIDGKPNPFMTSRTWREGETSKCLSWGFGRSEIEYDSSGEIKHLWPIPSNRIRKEVIDGKPIFVVSANGKVIALESHQVFELPWWSEDGIYCYSPMRLAARYLGLANAMEKFAINFFAHGSYVNGFITSPKSLDRSAMKKLREQLESVHSGLERSHRFAILDEGMSHSPFQQPLEEVHLTGSRVFGDGRIAALFRMTPDRLGYMDQASYKQLDATEIRFGKEAVLPMACRWESEVDDQLLGRWGSDSPEREPQVYYSRMNLDGVLRGDPKVQAEVLAKERQWGALSADEWRALKERNPIPGGHGKTYLLPGNMRPADQPYPEKRRGKEPANNGQQRALERAIAGSRARVEKRLAHSREKGEAWREKHRVWVADQFKEALEYFEVDGAADLAELMALKVLADDAPDLSTLMRTAAGGLLP